MAFGHKVSRKNPPPLFPGFSASSDPKSGYAAADAVSVAGPDVALPDPSDNEDYSSTAVAAHEKALVNALISSVRKTLKMEDVAEVVVDVAVRFGKHKPPQVAKAYPAYFDKFVYKDWEHLKRPFVVPKRSSVSRLNKATMIPVEESLSFKGPADRKAESVARAIFTIAGFGHSLGIPNAH